MFDGSDTTQVSVHDNWADVMDDSASTLSTSTFFSSASVTESADILGRHDQDDAGFLSMDDFDDEVDSGAKLGDITPGGGGHVLTQKTMDDETVRVTTLTPFGIQEQNLTMDFEASLSLAFDDQSSYDASHDVSFDTAHEEPHKASSTGVDASGQGSSAEHVEGSRTAGDGGDNVLDEGRGPSVVTEGTSRQQTSESLAEADVQVCKKASGSSTGGQTPSSEDQIGQVASSLSVADPQATHQVTERPQDPPKLTIDTSVAANAVEPTSKNDTVVDRIQNAILVHLVSKGSHSQPGPQKDNAGGSGNVLAALSNHSSSTRSGVIVEGGPVMASAERNENAAKQTEREKAQPVDVAPSSSKVGPLSLSAEQPSANVDTILPNPTQDDKNSSTMPSSVVHDSQSPQVDVDRAGMENVESKAPGSTSITTIAANEERAGVVLTGDDKSNNANLTTDIPPSKHYDEGFNVIKATTDNKGALATSSQGRSPVTVSSETSTSTDQGEGFEILNHGDAHGEADVSSRSSKADDVARPTHQDTVNRSQSVEVGDAGSLFASSDPLAGGSVTPNVEVVDVVVPPTPVQYLEGSGLNDGKDGFLPSSRSPALDNSDVCTLNGASVSTTATRPLDALD
ncbi:hypothetical protein E1B28_010242 [Marasmius oreades]|uniref:Uncharacterized protein n=1 Tax=Marasmius oreades TaxID=181124 RepID=A0A9P7RXX4_9AGAR|nr:uncharacterized protein E1B28_010242 [Marasmius oreades]KAG7091191.1 hypothetical protein E1B28_010242 [Marasmius oreades]